MQVGHWFGVPVKVRWTALATIVLLTVWLVAALGTGDEGTFTWSPTLLGLSLVVAIIASSCILLHELAHATVARIIGLRVASISLHGLGGLTEMADEPDDPRDEYLIAMAGPLVNITLSAIAFAVAGIASGDVATAATLLGVLNAAIGLSNLVPGPPLDGGALVRSALWRLSGDEHGAARNAALIGTILGYSMVGVGLGIALAAPDSWSGDGLWLALIGIWMGSAARVAAARAELRDSLKDVLVRQVMRPIGWYAERGDSVFAVLLATRDAMGDGLIRENGKPIGVCDRNVLAAVPWTEQEAKGVAEGMRPVAGTVSGDEPVLAILGRFGGKTTTVLCAVDDRGEPVGVLDAEMILGRLQASR